MRSRSGPSWPSTAAVTHVTGGFLGVDAFFCLSGFLITSLLLGEARHTGTIRLGAFWARRARRLLPALCLVLCFVGLYAWLAAPAGAYPGLRLDSLATLLYVANWHFVLQGQTYFQAALAPSPLTHTWSLAIEEQFYLVWPIVVLAIVKLRRSAATVLVVAAAGAVASTAWMAWLHQGGGDPTRLYYGTDTHAMTMLTGAALAAALALLAKGRDASSIRARGAQSVAVQVLGFGGAAVLGVMALKVTGTTPWLYRGGFLVAGVATAAIILSVVTVPRGILSTILGLGPVRYLGRISYGLYLWHYPLFLWLDHERTGLYGVRLLALRVGVTRRRRDRVLLPRRAPDPSRPRAARREGGRAHGDLGGRDRRDRRRHLARRGRSRAGQAPDPAPLPRPGAGAHHRGLDGAHPRHRDRPVDAPLRRQRDRPGDARLRRHGLGRPVRARHLDPDELAVPHRPRRAPHDLRDVAPRRGHVPPRRRRDPRGPLGDPQRAARRPGRSTSPSRASRPTSPRG